MKKLMMSIGCAVMVAIAGCSDTQKSAESIGIIGGAFINGKNIELPEGTEFYVQTKSDTVLYGVATTAQ